MRQISFLLAAFVLALALPGAATAQGALVEAAWLKENLGKPGLVVVDLRATKDVYLKSHIPGAVWTDYAKGGWRVKDKNGVEGMLPPPDAIASLVSSLGIDNGTHVILVSEGQRAQDMGTATRIYWTFKILGHDRLSILNRLSLSTRTVVPRLRPFRKFWMAVVSFVVPLPTAPLSDSRTTRPSIDRAQMRKSDCGTSLSRLNQLSTSAIAVSSGAPDGSRHYISFGMIGNHSSEQDQ